MRLVGMQAAAIGLSAILVSPCYAQSGACLAALVQDVHAVSFHQEAAYNLVQLIQNNLSKSQRDQMGIAIPIHGVPVSLNSSQAAAIADDYYNQTGVTWNEDTSIRMISSTLSPNAVEAYKTCVNGQQVIGVRVIAFDATPAHVFVKIRWIAGPDAPNVAKANLEWSGGKPHFPFPHRLSWKNSVTKIILFDRDPQQDFMLFANIGGSADAAEVPYIAPVSITVTPHPVSDGPHDLETDTWGHNEGPRSRCIPAPFGEMIDPSTAHIKKTVWVGPIDSTTYAEITHADSTQVCWKDFLRPLTAHQGGLIQFYVEYTALSFAFRRGDGQSGGR